MPDSSHGFQIEGLKFAGFCGTIKREGGATGWLLKNIRKNI
jgi:hypothetical protein